MAGITQKSCVIYFHCGPQKKFGRGERVGGRTDANQQKHAKNLKLKSDK